MPNPSAATVDNALNLIGARPSVAWNEILRLLKENLPQAVARWNTRNGTAIVAPDADKYFVAPAMLTDSYVNSITVNVSLSQGPLGSMGHKTVAQVAVAWIVGAVGIKEQVEDAYDGAAIIEAILCNQDTRHRWTNPAGIVVWQDISPTGITSLPQDWSQYFGTLTTLEMSQAGAGLWPAS